jgi:ornithine cyclodeaminase/alanine dehydrogenase-like protein (mu-crystallin family)
MATLRFLSRSEVASLMPDYRTLIGIVEEGLAAHGRGDVVLPPKAHIDLDDRVNGHFNILPGWVGAGVNLAGVKVIGDYVDNWRHGLPSEVGLLALMNADTGVPLALMDATLITAARTGAVTAAGARHLARPSSRVLGHIGARGSAFYNIASLAQLYDLKEVRISSKRPESRAKLAKVVNERLKVKTVAVDDVESAVADADIVVEATRLERPEVLIQDCWLKPGCLLVTYGWKMATDPATVARADKIVVDHWAQCCKGGQLHPLIMDGRLTRERVHAEIGEIAAGKRPGRQSDGETIVFWHRGFAISDIVVGGRLLRAAEQRGIGTAISLLDVDPDDPEGLET